MLIKKHISLKNSNRRNGRLFKDGSAINGKTFAFVDLFASLAIVAIIWAVTESQKDNAAKILDLPIELPKIDNTLDQKPNSTPITVIKGSKKIILNGITISTENDNLYHYLKKFRKEHPEITKLTIYADKDEGYENLYQVLIQIKKNRLETNLTGRFNK